MSTYIEEKIIDQIEVTSLDRIQVREALIIKRDDEQISKTYHRYVLQPGDDISSQPEKVKKICEAVWKKSE